MTFDISGAYAIKCLPYFAMGMIAVVIVDDAPASLDAIKAAKLPKKTRERLDAEIAVLGL